MLTVTSYTINVLTGGRWGEYFCARAYRNEWTICRAIDFAFRHIRENDPNHCKRCFLENKGKGI